MFQSKCKKAAIKLGRMIKRQTSHASVSKQSAPLSVEIDEPSSLTQIAQTNMTATSSLSSQQLAMDNQSSQTDPTLIKSPQMGKSPHAIDYIQNTTSPKYQEYTISHEKKRRKCLSHKQQEKVRTAIEVCFERKYYETYSDDCLMGKGGIVDSICEDLHFFSPRTVKRVVLDVKECLDNDTEYDPSRKTYTLQQTQKIKKHSFEEDLITTLIESGASLKTTMDVFNGLHQAPRNLPRVGITAIYNAIKRCNFISVSTQKIPQTDENNLLHRQARYNWFMQLLARMGEKVDFHPEDDGSEIRDRLKAEWVDIERLREKDLCFVLEQVAFWDEIHIYQVVGCHKDKTLIFTRNEDGIYDDGGTCANTSRVRQTTNIHLYLFS